MKLGHNQHYTAFCCISATYGWQYLLHTKLCSELVASIRILPETTSSLSPAVALGNAIARVKNMQLVFDAAPDRFPACLLEFTVYSPSGRWDF